MKIRFNMKREFLFGIVWLIVVNGLDSVKVDDTTNGPIDTNTSTTFNGIYISFDSNGNHITVPKDLCNKEKCAHFCSIEDEPNTPFKIKILDENNQMKTVELHKHFKIVAGSISCPLRHEFPFQLTYDGKVLMTEYNELKTHEEYCLQRNDKEVNELKALICVEPDPDEPSNYINIGIGMLVSVPFLIITFLVYLSVPELRNLHGKCFLCYLFCLIMAFIPLAIVKIKTCQMNEEVKCEGIPDKLCIVYAYTIYFSFISAFLWTSAISSDIWNSLGATVKYRYHSDKTTFYLYAIFSWGLSLLVTLFGYVADHNVFVPEFLQPKLGIDTCFMTTETIPRMVYLFIPLCITLLINIAFFILTALKIRSVKLELSVASCERNQSQPANFHTNKHSFTIYLRLCIVMGLNWIIEGIVMLTDVNETFEMILDMCNALTGVFIFGLFVLKPSVLHLIKKRWQLWFGASSPNGSITSYTSWVPPENLYVDVKQR